MYVYRHTHSHIYFINIIKRFISGLLNTMHQKLAYNYRAVFLLWFSDWQHFWLCWAGPPVLIALEITDIHKPEDCSKNLYRVRNFETSILYKTFCLLQIIMCNTNVPQNSILCNIFITRFSWKNVCVCVCSVLHRPRTFH